MRQRARPPQHLPALRIKQHGFVLVEVLPGVCGWIVEGFEDGVGCGGEEGAEGWAEPVDLFKRIRAVIGRKGFRAGRVRKDGGGKGGVLHTQW